MNDDLERQAEDDAAEVNRIKTLLINALQNYEPAAENPTAVLSGLVNILLDITQQLNVDKDSFFESLAETWDTIHAMTEKEEAIKIETKIH
ncbi:hypothetical protein N9478_10290 [Gammaproteobacteria bacterium]|nr:hypothetical protein [Gammaproteobacteria bacterium]